MAKSNRGPSNSNGPNSPNGLNDPGGPGNSNGPNNPNGPNGHNSPSNSNGPNSPNGPGGHNSPGSSGSPNGPGGPNVHHLQKALVYLLLGLAALVSLFPFYYMFVSSTNSNIEILHNPPSLTPGAYLIKNFAVLDEKIGVARVTFNSLFVALVFTGLTLLFHTMAGYALVKYRFRGRALAFGIIMLTMMLPQEMTFIPRFSLMNRLGWANSYQALVLPALANAFGVFLMRQNIINFPTSLIEQARIDGCNEMSIFFRIVLPNMKPALGALGIYMFMSSWNSFMWPLIILGTKDMYTFPVALAVLDGNPWRKEMGVMMLAVTIAVLPTMLIFLVMQRQFISGIMGGAIKE